MPMTGWMFFAGGWRHPPVEPTTGRVSHRPESMREEGNLKCSFCRW